jgi:hypothetical protein
MGHRGARIRLTVPDEFGPKLQCTAVSIEMKTCYGAGFNTGANYESKSKGDNICDTPFLVKGQGI